VTREIALASPGSREGVCEIGFCLPLEKWIGEATNTDESFLVGGFNFLGALKLDLRLFEEIANCLVDSLWCSTF
jgi:hypothetical protein